MTAQLELRTPELRAPRGTLPIGEGWQEVPATSDIVFPFDGAIIAQAPQSVAADSLTALDAAEAARQEVANLTTAERKSILSAVYERLRDDAQRFEDILVLETGKPRVDCRTEVNRTIVTLQATVEEASRIHGETVPLDVQELGRGMIGYYTSSSALLGSTTRCFSPPTSSHRQLPRAAQSS